MDARPNAAVYGTLSGSQIRLLEIQSAHLETSELVCTLRVHDFSEDFKQDYEALSWCWGTSQDLTQITIYKAEATNVDQEDTSPGYDFTIRTTLFRALQALRLRNKTRIIWIDAICINQDDSQERNHQVARMSAIYGTARNVCIWLGEEKENSRIALEFIEKQLSKPYWLEKHITEDKYLERWTALRDLMKRTWFSRRWIVQEVALARAATVHCGHQHVIWVQFTTAVSIMVQSRGTLEKLVAKAKADHTLHVRDTNLDEVKMLGAVRLADVSDRLFKRDAGNVLHRTSKLENLIAWLPLFESGEPRDIVYALLALARDTRPTSDHVPDIINGTRLDATQRKRIMSMRRRLIKQPVESFPIKYEEPVLDVYQRFVSFAMKSATPSRALDIICRPFAMKHQPKSNDGKSLPDPKSNDRAYDLPSWLPDIESHLPFIKQQLHNHGDRVGTMYRYERVRGDLFVSAPDAVSHYSAADNKAYNPLKVKFRRRRDHFSMFAEGFVLDQVEEEKAASQDGNVPNGWITLGTHEDIPPGAFVRTLTADRGPNGHCPAFYPSTLEVALRDHRRVGLQPEKEIREADSSQVIEVMEHLISTVTGRKLIKTKHHKRLGLAPEDTKVGDLICILYGCSVPVILRESERPKNTELDEEDDKAEMLERGAELKTILFKWATREKHPQTKAQAILRRVRAREQGRRADDVVHETAFRLSQLWFRLLALIIDTHFLARALLFASTIGPIAWFMDETLLGCVLSVMCFAHYAHAVTDGRNRLANAKQIIHLAPFVLVWLAIDHHVFSVSLLIWALTVLLYPQLFPEKWSKKIGEMLRHTKATPDEGWKAKYQASLSRTPDADYLQRVEETSKVAFTLVGESYIDGMMTGEAIKAQNESYSSPHPALRKYPVVFEIR